MISILQYPSTRLLRASQEASLEEAAKLVKLLKRVCGEQLTLGNNVLGMAAPQIGFNKRVFLARDRVFINPKMGLKSGKVLYKEGCFSLPRQGYEVPRYTQFLLSWTDEMGALRYQLFHNASRHDLAHVIQHEYDHLEGKLVGP